jgi:hypothetical protein
MAKGRQRFIKLPVALCFVAAVVLMTASQTASRGSAGAALTKDNSGCLSCHGQLEAGAPLAMAAASNAVSGGCDYLYVASGQSGLFIFDLRNGILRAPVAVIEDINAVDASRAARYLYVVVKGVGVHIYDTENPAAATLVTTVPIPTAVRAVPWGIHLFVAAGEGGLVVVDIADHRAPGIVGSLRDIKAADVALYAHYQTSNAFATRAYVADPDFGVRVVDLLPEFSSPKLVGGLELPGASGLDTYTRWLKTDGTIPSREHDYLYVAAGPAGLHVFDITEPDAIVKVAALTGLGGRALDVDVASHLKPPGVDDYALVANSDVGVQIVDVIDPRNPVYVTTAGPAGASRVFVEVQQMDRFIDEMGGPLKENSYAGASGLSRADIVRILSADLGEWGRPPATNAIKLSKGGMGVSPISLDRPRFSRQFTGGTPVPRSVVERLKAGWTDMMKSVGSLLKTKGWIQ